MSHDPRSKLWDASSGRYVAVRRRNKAGSAGFLIGRLLLVAVCIAGVAAAIYAARTFSPPPNAAPYDGYADIYRAMAVRYRAIAAKPRDYDLREEHRQLAARWPMERAPSKYREANVAVTSAQLNLALLRDASDLNVILGAMRGLDKSADAIERSLP